MQVPHKQAIFNSTEESTLVTNVYSGKSVRAIRNQFIEEMKQYEKDILDYPLQNTLTQLFRKAAAQQNNPDLMSMWAGQATRLNRDLAAKDLINAIINEANQILNLLCGWNR